MIVKKNIIIILSLIILFLVPVKTFAAEITVAAEVDIHSELELARKEAIQKAFQKAIQKLAGSYIRKSTLLENSKFINQRIYSKSEGYVSNYQIISEESKGNRYIIQMRAEVTKALLSDLEELKLILETQTTNPRLLVLVDNAQLETLVSNPDNQFTAIEEEIAAQFGNPSVNQKALAYQELLKTELKKLGFKIVSKSTTEEFLNQSNSSQNQHWSVEALNELSNYNDQIDILLRANFSLDFVGNREIKSGTLNIEEGSSNLVFYNSQNKDIIDSFKVYGKGYARDQQQAEKIAVEKTAQNASQTTVERLLEVINFNNGQKYLKLELNNTEFNQLQPFELLLKKLAGIRSYELKNFSQKTAVYELKVLQQTSVLANRFVNEASLDLGVLELNSDYLSLSLN